MKETSSFFKTLSHLRKSGHITIFTKLKTISAQEETAVIAFLQSEFELESMEYPGPVSFDAASALWAAKTVFYSAQLLLVRENTIKDLAKYFPEVDKPQSLAAILSADLSLRFLPEILIQLNIADSKDPLLPVLEKYLQQFHYSAIGSDVEIAVADWATELTEPLYRKLYLERVVAKKDQQRAGIPYLNQQLHAAFGLYKNQFWQALKTINQVS